MAIIPRKQPTDTVKMGLADDEKALARAPLGVLGFRDTGLGLRGSGSGFSSQKP